ncbi:hypothetical protein PM8797T_08749 [Gimesia maris DSM 8797]|nr:hypothetical protein PM8797T_08749 [Gimesia maris DSM 8797]
MKTPLKFARNLLQAANATRFASEWLTA